MSIISVKPEENNFLKIETNKKKQNEKRQHKEYQEP